MSTDSPRRTVHLPFDFGQVVYHRARSERVAGLVIGFVVVQNDLRILVRWGDDLCQVEHSFFELSTEYEPFSEVSKDG